MAALEGLSTVGGVSVTRTNLGLSVESDGTTLAVSFPMWTVTFDGDCTFADSAWESCPANVGDLEVCLFSRLGETAF